MGTQIKVRTLPHQCIDTQASWACIDAMVIMFVIAFSDIKCRTYGPAQCGLESLVQRLSGLQPSSRQAEKIELCDRSW